MDSGEKTAIVEKAAVILTKARLNPEVGWLTGHVTWLSVHGPAFGEGIESLGVYLFIG